MESAYFSRPVCGNDHLFISRSRRLPPSLPRLKGCCGCRCGDRSFHELRIVVGGEREREAIRTNIKPGGTTDRDRDRLGERTNPFPRSLCSAPPATTVATVGRKPSSRPPFSARTPHPAPRALHRLASRPAGRAVELLLAKKIGARPDPRETRGNCKLQSSPVGQ